MTSIASVTVLTSGRGAGSRAGARILPLGPDLARQPAVVGTEVAVTAGLVGQLPFARSVVVVVPPSLPAESCVLPVSLTSPLTVTVTRPAPAGPGPGGTLSLYNLHESTLPEAFVEAVAAARRCGLVTALGNVVLLVQEFVPAAASAVVRAWPDRTSAVHIDGRWGLAEQRSAADTFEVPPGDSAVRETVVRKPTAILAAAGGTHTVAMPPEWQERLSLGRETIRSLAALARDAAATAGVALSLDIVVGDEGPVVLRCRQTSP